MNEELNQAVQALTDEDMAELAGGRLSPTAAKVAKIAGITTAGVVGTVGAVAGVTAIVGAAKHDDGAYYFKKWFGGGHPAATKTTPASPIATDPDYLKGEKGTPAYDMGSAWDPNDLRKMFGEKKLK